jgi:predicted unusual protein kinase regulating ubiquinone biosynthesis (AarF/ABC1/UbiB family)
MDIKLLHRTVGRVPFFKPIVDLVGDTLLGEVDYLKEASNAEEFGVIQSDVPFVLVPKPIRSLTTRKVLVLEWVEGQSLKEIGDEKEKLLRLTKMAVDCTITQLLLSNVLHGDPHPGNVLYTGEGKLAYLDFGVLCRVKPRQAQALLSASVHIINKQYRDFVTDLVALEVLDDQNVSIAEVVEAFDKEFNSNEQLTDQMRLNRAMTKLGYRYKFNVPPWYTTLIRALAPLEGYGLRADPSFNILDECYPLIMKQICFDCSLAGRRILREFLLTSEEWKEDDEDLTGSGYGGSDDNAHKQVDVVNFSLLRGMSLQSIKSLIEEFVPIMVSSRAKALRSTLKVGGLPRSVHLHQQKGCAAFFRTAYLFAFFLAQALKKVVLPGVLEHILGRRSGRVKRNRLRRLAMTLSNWTHKYKSSLRLSHGRNHLKLALVYAQALLMLFLSMALSMVMLASLFAVELKDSVENLLLKTKTHPTW